MAMLPDNVFTPGTIKHDADGNAITGNTSQEQFQDILTKVRSPFLPPPPFLPPTPSPHPPPPSPHSTPPTTDGMGFTGKGKRHQHDNGKPEQP